jgi:hypothetical protein
MQCLEIDGHAAPRLPQVATLGVVRRVEDVDRTALEADLPEAAELLGAVLRSIAVHLAEHGGAAGLGKAVRRLGHARGGDGRPVEELHGPRKDARGEHR